MAQVQLFCIQGVLKTFEFKLGVKQRRIQLKSHWFFAPLLGHLLIAF